MRRNLPVLFACLVCGCAQLPPSFTGADESRQVSDLIGYVQGVAAMQPEGQRGELNDATQTYSKDHALYARLRLALLLSLPGTGFADDARAVNLLEPVASNTGAAATPLHQFAGWLYAQVGERSREQRKSAQLKEQLDALRAIERTLIERGQGRSR